MSEPTPFVIASLNYSGKAQAALVGLRVGDAEVAMDAPSARELALKLVALATEAEMETALVDFLTMKGGLINGGLEEGVDTASPEAGRVFVSLFRQHRTDLRNAEVQGRMIPPG